MANLNTAISMGKRQLVESIWSSVGIEGYASTFLSTDCILNNLPVMTTRDEVLFVVNMKRAWQFLFENIDYPINLPLLRELNKISMDNLIFEPGNLRRVPVSIGGTKWQPSLPNHAEILNNLDRINQIDNKLESALELFCYIARTQMFQDGNKRVAQLATNKVLMEHDIGILNIQHPDIPEFKELLVKFYETGNSEPFKAFLYDKGLLLTPEYQKNTAREESDKDIAEEDVVR